MGGERGSGKVYTMNFPQTPVSTFVIISQRGQGAAAGRV